MGEKLREISVVAAFSPSLLVCFAELSVCLGRAFCKYLPVEINLFFFFHFVFR